MNRRKSLQRLMAVGALIGLPRLTTATSHTAEVLDSTSGPQIGQLIRIAWSGAIEAEKRGRDWVDPELQQAQNDGRIFIRPLGPIVEVVDNDSNRRLYEIEEIAIPMVWSPEDEKLPTSKRISLAASLIRNGLQAHDFVFLEKLGNRRAVVSQHYRYDLGATQYNETFTRLNIFTAVAFID